MDQSHWPLKLHPTDLRMWHAAEWPLVAQRSSWSNDTTPLLRISGGHFDHSARKPPINASPAALVSTMSSAGTGRALISFAPGAAKKEGAAAIVALAPLVTSAQQLGREERRATCTAMCPSCVLSVGLSESPAARPGSGSSSGSSSAPLFSPLA